MKVLTVILLLVTALMYVLAGTGYLLGGTLTLGLGALLSKMASLGGGEASQSMGGVGQFAGGLALAGVCYWISALGAIGASVRLGQRDSPMPLIGGGLVVVTEAVSVVNSGFGFLTGLALAAGVLALGFAMRNLRAAEGGSVPLGAVLTEFGGVFGIAAAWFLAFGVLLGYATHVAQDATGEPVTTAAAARSEPAAAPAPAPEPQPEPAAANPAAGEAPASELKGQIKGQPLTRAKAFLDYRNSSLEIREGEDFFPDLAISMFLNASGPDRLANRELSANALGGQIMGSMHISVRPPGQQLPTTDFLSADNAGVRVSFGALAGDKIPGRISLRSGDTFLEGAFVATITNHDGLLATAPGDDSFDALKYVIRRHLDGLYAGKPFEVTGFDGISKSKIGDRQTASSTVHVTAGGAAREIRVLLAKQADAWTVTEPASLGN